MTKHNHPFAAGFWLVLVLIAFTAFAARTSIAQPPPSESPSEGEPGEESFGFGFHEAMRGFIDQIWAPQSRYRDGTHVRSVFQEVIEPARRATVQVRSGSKRIGWGGVVGPDGWVLSKASLVSDNEDATISCRLSDGRELPARVVGVDREYDLVMLKIDAMGLKTLKLSDQAIDVSDLLVSKRRAIVAPEQDEADQTPGPMAGDWVATVGDGKNPVAVGVVSVLPREIERRKGFLGVGYAPNDQTVVVTTVTRNSAASRAGVKKGDVILKISGEPIPTPQDLVRVIQAKHPGDPITIRVRRASDEGEEEIVLRAVLTGRVFDNRAFQQNSLGGKLSKRRFGFPAALQHDTVLGPSDCGGPVVDLDGRVIGFNIARSGRTESYAIPTAVVVSRLYDLMSGSLAPTQSVSTSTTGEPVQ